MEWPVWSSLEIFVLPLSLLFTRQMY
jgi:hypothetical protein